MSVCTSFICLYFYCMMNLFVSLLLIYLSLFVNALLSFRLLCSMSTNPCELWVSIVEKAYMKLNGGYDYPGSNSGIDLNALTGWIPEQIFFEESKASQASTGILGINNRRYPPSQPSSERSSSGGQATVLDHKQSETRAWERLKSAHAFGDCLVTISTTDSLTAEQEATTGLVPGHAYAVLDVKEAGILKMLKVPIIVVMPTYHACRLSAAVFSIASHVK